MVSLYTARVIRVCRNRHGIFWGLIFGPVIFLGFAGSPRDFLGSWLLAPFNHPRHLKSQVPPLGVWSGQKKRCFNHLLFMDDLKLYGKKYERQVGILVNIIRIFSKDIGMEFGRRKCTVLNMTWGKVFSCKGIVSAEYGQTIRGLENGDGYKVPWNIGGRWCKA